MFTLIEIQAIFDYGMRAYSQDFMKPRTRAINNGAEAAASAAIVAHAEAKMASKVKQAFLTASMNVTLFNAHLSGNDFRITFDKQLAFEVKKELENLFGIEGITLNERQAFIYGKGYFLTGLYHEAITTLEAAIIENPSCIAHAYYYLGKSNACLKNHTKAKNYFLWLLEQEKKPTLLSDYYDAIGMSCFAQGDHEEALINYEQALKMNSANLSALHNFALIYLTFATQLKDNEQSFEHEYLSSQSFLSKIFEIEPHHPHALHTQASLLELTEDDENAIKFYLQARMHCSEKDQETLSAIRVNLAERYAQRGHKFYQSTDYITAQNFYIKSLNEDALHHIAKNQLGMCLYKLQDFVGARQHFNDLIHFPMPLNPNKTEPNKTEIETNQEIHFDAWLNRAVCLRKSGALKLAKGSLSIASTLSPEDVSLQEETREIAALTIQQQYSFFKKRTQFALQDTQQSGNVPKVF